MVRETSIEAYNKIKENGLLSKRRLQVYELLFDHGPMTQKELAQKLPPIYENSLRPRFAELERCGVIKTIGRRKCLVTGENVLEWDVTNNLPIKFEKPHRETCQTCKGKGYIETQQAKFDI